MGKSISFVCLGDSLTAGTPGFSGYGLWSGNPESQYLYWLDLLVKKNFPSIEVEFLNYGVGGDVVRQMHTRYSRDVLTQVDHIDYVFVMGGNNEVVWRGYDVDSTLNELRSLFLTIIRSGAKPIALEILPVTNQLHLVEKVKETNKGLIELGKELNIPIVLLYNALADKTKLRIDPKYDCGDGDHLNIDGYRIVGQEIFDKYLKTFISEIIN